MSDRYTDREEYDPNDYDAGLYSGPRDDSGSAFGDLVDQALPFGLFIIGIILYPTVLDYFLTGVCWLLRKMRLPLLTAYKFYWLAGLSPALAVVCLGATKQNGMLVPAITMGVVVAMLSLGSIRSNEHKLAPDYK